MLENVNGNQNDRIVTELISTQLEHFRSIQPPCRGMELPDGILLRHTQSPSLYFYLRSGIENGKIKTTVFATDSPYDRQKAHIGSVVTPMFEAGCDFVHLEKLEHLVRGWVGFVADHPDREFDFHSFKVES
jgi:hypothetical protein